MTALIHLFVPGDLTPTERFLAKMEEGPGGCLLWTGYVDDRGYARFTVNGKRKAAAAHRVSYEFFVGPIPAGLTIDHLCRVRHCVNPAHLEPVTQRENILRGVGSSAIAHARDHCARGHAYDATNLYVTSAGVRQCRRCALDRQRAASARMYRDRGRRVCEAADCETVLPTISRIDRRYCSETCGARARRAPAT